MEESRTKEGDRHPRTEEGRVSFFLLFPLCLQREVEGPTDLGEDDRRTDGRTDG